MARKLIQYIFQKLYTDSIYRAALLVIAAVGLFVACIIMFVENPSDGVTALLTPCMHRTFKPILAILYEFMQTQSLRICWDAVCKVKGTVRMGLGVQVVLD